jgi:hypothetical protein
MNKSLILRITGGVAALVGLLSFGHFLSFTSFFESVNYLIGENPTLALGLVLSWLVAPFSLLLAGAVAVVFHNKIKIQVSAILLIATSALHALMWIVLAVTRNSGFVSLEQFFETFSLITGESDLARLLAAVATPFSLLVLGAAIWILVTAPKQVKELDITQPPARKAPSGFTQFLATLVDSKLENFISRRVSGVLYIITAWLIIAAAALSELGLLFQLVSGNFFAFVAMLLVPVITLLTLIIVRMAFEAGIALIVIAENTKK